VSRPVQLALEEAGAVLLRQHRHFVYEMPSGAGLFFAKTPSDWRAERNQLARIRRSMAGVA